jgi:4'-phosphopantetheinyl transferase
MRIGVDVERSDRSVAADKLAAKFLTPTERDAMTHLSPDERRIRFLRHWTCKEAMSKATGDGLAAPFRRIGIDVDPRGRLRVDAGPAPYAGADWELHAVAVPAPYLGTLARWRAWHGEAA